MHLFRNKRNAIPEKANKEIGIYSNVAGFKQALESIY